MTVQYGEITAKEMLTELIHGVRGGIESCLLHSGSSTKNTSVCQILQDIERSAQYALNEIEKGNAK